MLLVFTHIFFSVSYLIFAFSLKAFITGGDRYKRAMGQSTFEYAAAKEWNDLFKELRACKTLGLFKIRTFKF